MTQDLCEKWYHRLCICCKKQEPVEEICPNNIPQVERQMNNPRPIQIKQMHKDSFLKWHIRRVANNRPVKLKNVSDSIWQYWFPLYQPTNENIYIFGMPQSSSGSDFLYATVVNGKVVLKPGSLPPSILTDPDDRAFRFFTSIRSGEGRLQHVNTSDYVSSNARRRLTLVKTEEQGSRVELQVD